MKQRRRSLPPALISPFKISKLGKSVLDPTRSKVAKCLESDVIRVLNKNTLSIYTSLLTSFYFRRTLLPSALSGLYNRTSLLHPVVYVCHRDSHRLVPSRYIVFPSISWPSPWSFSYWVDHPCFTLGSCSCHPLDVWPPPDVVCSPGCMFTRHLISLFLISSILVFPAALNLDLCCCQHLPSFAGEGPVFTLVKTK